ncbi:hypothetical protein ACFVUN_01705 [Kitasatospora griseola]|uniref:hypothetical protein n=1 Tax=Kitasatospora griseola TaxID=2064 RepID=UPI0036DC46E9
MNETIEGTMEIVQLADLGAAALVAEMTTTAWESVRELAVRLFRRGGEIGVEQEIHLIDEARRRLTEAAESDLGAVTERLRQELMIQLAAFLQKNPDAAGELQQIVNGAAKYGPNVVGRVSAHHNTHSQIVISGGAISAGGGIHFRVPEAGR